MVGPVVAGPSSGAAPVPSSSPPPYNSPPGQQSQSPPAGPPSPTPPPQTPLPGYIDLSPMPPRYSFGSNSDASDDSAGAGDPTDCDEADLWRRYGQCIPLLQPHCDGPNMMRWEQPHLAGPFTVCNVCRAKNLNGDAGPPYWWSMRAVVRNSYIKMVYQHVGEPVPSWQLMDNTTTTVIALGEPLPAGMAGPFQHGLQAFLCRYCQDDEILHWRRRKQNPAYLAANPPPPNAAAGEDNECVCSHVILSPYFCRLCNIKCYWNELWTATANAHWLHQLARDGNGQRVAADAVLQQNRQKRKQWLACRCGREAPRPVRNPNATYCLTCEGVMIHIAGNIAGNAGLASRLRVDWARPLNNLRGNYPLWTNRGAHNHDVPDVRRSNSGP